ncbi:DUF397 domain-containing protein [Streptomyces himalayensis]|uniref:DUF397 domain-containing protein n=1 Tax=Streptomyces himalayensis subsp. himalayensis TaxID=2756131 RepID=A0A7W0DRA1_9ACTN|nr:DUF397 domain-containing protein [Streptomyces himalayensis]MBA2949726.1 DUF397 domain-containing protein [Streptomyces himalayensis subsp. himalayensis]
MPADSLPAADCAWFKSSYSGGNATECVEAAFVPSGVLVRDSKRPSAPHIAVSAEAWNHFVMTRKAYGPRRVQLGNSRNTGGLLGSSPARTVQDAAAMTAAIPKSQAK